MNKKLYSFIWSSWKEVKSPLSGIILIKQCSRIPLPVTRGKWNLRSGNWKTECYLPVGKWISCHYPKHILPQQVNPHYLCIHCIMMNQHYKTINFFLNLHKSNQRKTVKNTTGKQYSKKVNLAPFWDSVFRFTLHGHVAKFWAKFRLSSTFKYVK